MSFNVRGRALRLTAALGALLLPGAALANHGQAATTYTAASGAAFNNPEGTADEQYAIMNRIEANIDNAPAGSVIRFAIYSITIPDIATKLKAAHDRGVHVRILMDAHAVNALWTDLAANLNNHADGKDSKGEYYSFARVCTNGCLTGFSGAALHAKYYLFSTAGLSKQVVTVSSANPTTAQATVAWNTSDTLVGDSTIYNGYVSFFYAMTQGQKGTYQPDYYSSHRVTNAYYWPKARTKSDTFIDFLNLLSPNGAVIRIAMFEWTAGRIDLANKLVALGAAGAKITVLFAGGAVDPTIKSTLANKTGITVLDTSKNIDEDSTADHYTHSKYMMIDGVYNGTARKYVWAGSSNFTVNGIYHNDESDLKLAGATYTAYLENFNQQLAAITPTTVKKMTAERRAEGEVATIPIDPAELADS